MKIYKKQISLGLAALVLSAISLGAQPNPSTAVQQMENFQRTMEQQQPLTALRAGTNAPEVYPGENADIGPQHVLRLIPHRTWFEVKADSQYFYTDNALLTQNNKTATTEFVNTISAAFAPTPYKWGPGRFAPEIGYLSQWYNYGLGGNSTVNGGGHINSTDFNVQTAFAGAKYLFPNNWILFGEFDYTRLLSQASPPAAYDYQEFYQDYTPSLGVQRLFPIGDRGVFAASLQGDYHVSWTANPPHNSQDRADGVFSLSFSYQLWPQVVVQPYYRFQYIYYRYDSATPHHSGRDDYLNSVGLIAAYNFKFVPGLVFRGFVNYDNKNSDDISPALGGAQRYHDYNVGGELSYTLRF